MASVDTRISTNINRTTVAFALNNPANGPVWRYRELSMHAALTACIAGAPVNDPLNAVHRGGVVGTYKASMRSDRIGSNQYQLRFNITNSAGHAGVVENGRAGSSKDQFFSWAGGVNPGKPEWHRRTGAREGTHHIEETVRRVMRTLS